MKRLVRLLLINWYRLERVGLEIGGHTAFIGPNASGKSSLLDAIQAVLVGGDKRWWNPNASAGEKSTRSLRDYCLGVVRNPDNPDLSQEFRPRDQAISYLVLVFHDEAGGPPVSVGLALHARLEDPQETIDGRFVAPGLDLILPDLTDQTPDGPLPKPWKRLREELLRRAGTEFRSHTQTGEYQRHLCALLSDGRRHLDPPRLLRAFRNAITFAPIRNVSDFVRNHILEERPIQVRALQQALKRYRDIRSRTREARDREQALAAIDHHYQRAERAEHLGYAWRWVTQEALFNALEAQLIPLRERLELRERDIIELSERIDALKQRWELADQALEEANRRLAATDVEQQRARIRAERKMAEQAVAGVTSSIQAAHRGLGAVHRLLDRADLLADTQLASTLETVADLLRQGEGLLAATWPPDPESVQRAVERLSPLIGNAVGQSLERFEQLVREEGEMAHALKTLRERIVRLERGESDLQPSTLRLISLLQNHGIDAVPLCDRVDVKEEQWRNALESFLGGHREALLVAPEQVRDAIRLYRHEGRRLNIQGSRVINTTKTADWLGRCDTGSLAEMVVSDDSDAVAYVNRRCGNVLRVESEDELLHHERAITADGMLATGGSILRQRPLEPMLGREARAQTLETLKRRFADDGSNHYEKQQEKTAIKDFREERLMPLDRHLASFPDLKGLVAERDEQQRQLVQLDAEERALMDDEEYARLKDDVARRRTERDEIVADRDSAMASLRDNEKGQQAQLTEYRRLEEQSEQTASERGRIGQIQGFNAELATERLDELQTQELFAGEESDSWQALGEKAARRAGTQEAKTRNQRNQAREQLNDYWARWSPEDRPVTNGMDDHLTLAAWVVSALTQLRDTQLSRYVTEAENALREAEHAFRADFVGKLRDNLSLLEEQRKELNRNLRHRPFHGQYYSFVKQPEPDLRQVLDWVMAWNPEQGQDVGGLFDSALDPNHPHREAIAKVRNLLMEAAGTDGEGGAWGERLADYRQYYHFDVRMSDDREGGGNPELLSRRLGKGSGGEHQSPFYVAIGAALAAAYRIERQDDGTRRGGMALAVFDEAFSKLDLQNTVSALGFLDELGLQVLLAAPDEKYGQIAEHVDTIVNVYRDGGNVHIDTETIKPEAKRVLSADNPVT